MQLMAPEHPVSFSFTAASLRPELVRIIAEAYVQTGSWELAKAKVLATNSLQCRSASSALRLERELRQRLEALTDEQINFLVSATAEDRAAIAWLAACKRICFVFDFAAETLREKLTMRDPVLRPSDYEAFFESKRHVYPELAQLTPASQSKVRQVLRRMLAEVGLVVPGEAWGTVQRPALSPAVVRLITSDDAQWLAAFLVSESEIHRR